MPHNHIELENDTGFHIKLLWSEMDFKLYLGRRKDNREVAEGIQDEFNCTNKSL